jgi:5-(carboxyamino)imidazole ribonucleotide synthase
VCPASISQKTIEQAEQIAKRIAEQLQLVGVLAVEYFFTKDGKLLVNEMAPRVHNSGHHTIEACVTSQFEQHWRAILNFPLGDTSLIRPAVMVNLLGSEGFEGNTFYVGIENILKYSGVYPHLYGKKQVKAFRKMGHITITDKTLMAALKKAQKNKRNDSSNCFITLIMDELITGILFVAAVIYLVMRWKNKTTCSNDSKCCKK